MQKIITITYNDLSIPWGPAIHFLELWNSFYKLKSGKDIVGYAPKWKDGAPIKKPLFKLKIIKIPNIKKIRQVIYDLLISVKIYKHRFDFIYIRASSFYFFSIIVMKIFSINPIVELNGLLSEDHKSAGTNKWLIKLLNWQEQQLLKSANKIICVSQGIANKVISNGICKDKVHIITNGVSEDFFELKPKTSTSIKLKSIIYVGTFTPWDGAKHLPNLAKSFPKVTFLIVGDGERRAKIEENSPENMIFKGFQDYSKLTSIYSEVDAGIVLYEEERHKNVQLSSLKTLEYLASGLPIFSTNVNGQEFIKELGFGYLTKEKDMQNSFEIFLNNFSHYKNELSANREKYIDIFSWKRCAKETLYIFNSIESNETHTQGDNE